MADNDDLVPDFNYDETLTEDGWDKLYQSVNNNRRYRLAGMYTIGTISYNGSNLLTWTEDIKILFMSIDSDNFFVNTISASTLGCTDNNIIYCKLNNSDTTASLSSSTKANFKRSSLDNETGNIIIIGFTDADKFHYISGGVTDHTELSSIGTKTHTTIDSHIDSSSDPHSVTKSQVGLSSVDNVADASQTTLSTLTSGDVRARDSVGLVTSKASGDIFYWTTVLNRLGKGTNGEVLKLAAGIPAWGTDDNDGHGSGNVTQHTDVSDAGDGKIITADERTALHDIATRASLNLATTNKPTFSGVIASNERFYVTDSYKNTAEEATRDNIDKYAYQVESDYVVNYYYPLLGLSNNDNSATKAKVGIYTKLTSTGSILYFGVSNNYGSGITAVAYLDQNGYFYAPRVYNAVYNDYADYWGKLPDDEIAIAGKAYVGLKNKGITRATKRNDPAVLGICSDTYGFAVGKKVGDVPLSVCGFILAFVDKEYSIGTRLINDENGNLTKALADEKIDAIAKFVSEVKEKGRYWVKVLL